MRCGFPQAGVGMRVGLLGGSFDPAHAGHVHVSQQALARFRLDRVWWLVSPGNPLKTQGPAGMETRIMHARTILHNSRIIVSDLEARLGTRWTIDTVSALLRHYPGTRFVWLMGADNLIEFDRWHRWRQIAASLPIGVLARPGSRLAARNSRAARIMANARLPEAMAPILADRRPPAWTMLNIPMHPASSTAIRARRAACPWPPGDDAAAVLPDMQEVDE